MLLYLLKFSVEWLATSPCYYCLGNSTGACTISTIQVQVLLYSTWLQLTLFFYSIEKWERDGRETGHENPHNPSAVYGQVLLVPGPSTGTSGTRYKYKYFRNQRHNILPMVLFGPTSKIQYTFMESILLFSTIQVQVLIYLFLLETPSFKVINQQYGKSAYRLYCILKGL